MLRRDFLLSISGASVLPLMSFSAHTKPKEIDFPVSSPSSIFWQMPVWSDGRNQFSLDYLRVFWEKKTGCKVPERKQNDGQSVYVPPFKMRFFGKSKEEIQKKYLAELDKMCGDMLLAAAKQNDYQINNRESLASSIRNRFPKHRELIFTEYDNHLIGVDVSRLYGFIIPVLTHLYVHPIPYRGIYEGFIYLGMAILDPSDVLCGRIS